MLARLRPRRPPNWVLFAFGGLTLLIIGSITVGIALKLLGHYSWPVEQIFRTTPDQPIDFPHPQHVDAGIDCVFCHRLAPTERMASVPPVEQCIFCHQIIAKDSPEVEKLVAAFQQGEPINWTRVHRLPDHVRFVHEAHVTFFSQEVNYTSAQGEYDLPQQQAVASVTCSICHGNVASMQQVSQVRDLRMGDCVSCHRQWNAPTDCVTCHY